MSQQSDAPSAAADTKHVHVTAVVKSVISFLVPFIGLLVVTLIFTAINLPNGWFLTVFRMKLIANQTATVAMGALGMTVIIISGGIDLSVGSLLALCSVSLAAMLRAGVDPMLAVFLVLSIGMAAGAFNGVLITGLRLVPFIITLGSMLIFRGLAHLVADQKKIQAAEQTPAWLANLMTITPPGSWKFISTGAWMVVVLGLALAVVLRYSVFGRYVFALGSNEGTARLCGVNVPLMKIAVYAVGGFFMGIAGIFDFNYLGKQGDPTGGDAMELKIIAAVVIGGGSLSGGRGSVLGTIIGALTMTVLTTGCNVVGVSDPVEKIIIGAIIVAAVAIDRFLHRGRN
jgi:ribose/xylose/arabinose/galactoside ABC-type transport system permease subunit